MYKAGNTGSTPIEWSANGSSNQGSRCLAEYLVKPTTGRV